MRLMIAAAVSTMIMCLLTALFILFSGVVKASMGVMVFYCSLVAITTIKFSLLFGVPSHFILKKRKSETLSSYIICASFAGFIAVLLVVAMPAIVDDVPFSDFHLWLSIAMMAASLIAGTIFYVFLKPTANGWAE